MSARFDQFALPDRLVAALRSASIHQPFPIQTDAIPPALAGRDILGRAPTGSGKTLAFGLPLLASVVEARPKRPRALVLAPTRELAEQIHADLSPLARAVGRRILAIYGGVGYGSQRSGLRRGVDVVVATPGRLEDLLQQGDLSLDMVDIVVVDEADRMADMGFLPAVKRLLDLTSEERQTLLFSATLDGDVAVLSRRYQHDPVEIEVELEDGAATERADVDHHFWKVSREQRLDATVEVVEKMGRTIVFTRTRRGADRLAKQLERRQVSAVAMHGGRSQSQRRRALTSFSSGRAAALVATDVAARGIHVDGVASVVHFDPAGDHKDYLHRSGRTARAGAGGTVVSLVQGDQVRDARRLVKHLNLGVEISPPDPERLASHSPAAPARDEDERSGRETRSVFVGNLPWAATESDLRSLFSPHGRIDRATVVRQKQSGRSKGFGFVEMSTSDSEKAIRELQGARIGSRPLKIRLAR